MCLKCFATKRAWSQSNEHHSTTVMNSHDLINEGTHWTFDSIDINSQRHIELHQHVKHGTMFFGDHHRQYDQLRRKITSR